MSGIVFSSFEWINWAICLLPLLFFAGYVFSPQLVVESFANALSGIKRSFVAIETSITFYFFRLFYYLVFSLALYLFLKGHSDAIFLEYMLVAGIIALFDIVKSLVLHLLHYVFNIEQSKALIDRHYNYHYTVLCLLLYPLIFFSAMFQNYGGFYNHIFFVIVITHLISMGITLVRSFEKNGINFLLELIFFLTAEVFPLAFLYFFIPTICLSN